MQMQVLTSIAILLLPDCAFSHQYAFLIRRYYRARRVDSTFQPYFTPSSGGLLSDVIISTQPRLIKLSHFEDNEDTFESETKMGFYEYPPSALPSNKNDLYTNNSTASKKTISTSESILQLFSIPLESSFERIMDSAKATRLLKYRSYAKREAFMQDSITSQPTLGDLSPPPRTDLETLWISPLYRWAILLASYLIFPQITTILEKFVSPSSSTELAGIVSQFAPGVSVLYGTFISYTLSILYERQNKIQTNVSIESSVLSIVCRNTLALFREDSKRLIEGSQCIADQIRHLVKESRGEELMCLIYSDPYAKIYELLLDKERDLSSKDHPDTVRIFIFFFSL